MYYSISALRRRWRRLEPRQSFPIAIWKWEHESVTSYANLLAPGRIGTLELPNRLFQTAMGTNLASRDGTISDESVAFYAARAAGGAALLTMGAVGVSYPRGQVQTNQVGISDDRFLPGLRRMTDAIHRNGGRISAQLHHGGTTSSSDIVAGVPLLCPSLPLPRPGDEDLGRSLFETLFPDELALSSIGHAVAAAQFKEMDHDDIAALISDFADGAARAVEAGFDAIELHAGHSYVINFLPFSGGEPPQRSLRRLSGEPGKADEGSDRGDPPTDRP